METDLHVHRQVRPVAKQEPKLATRQGSGFGFGFGLLQFVWVVTVLTWPLLKWVMALDCVYQFARMIYFWDAPGEHGFIFMAHFAAFTVLTYYVSVYKPRGI